MKSILLTLFSFFIILFASAQENFEWDVRDSLEVTKAALYSKVKMFIAETWKSADDVIQNDDKEGGVVLIKGLSSHEVFYEMNNHVLTYSYNVKFQFRENECRLVIENVMCSRHRVGYNEWGLMPVSDSYTWTKKEGRRITKVNAKHYMTLMTALKSDLQTIADDFVVYINAKSTDDGW